ncbi:WhiB family transcriptional regulator [Prescottella agglutinans]|uniref:WhiB family transcriptional regulator n=1 Tax=Prescottella agglutinans TaxID=1644129 RepID=UPI00247521BE|nr:WhiB family transcriptional regulator [Prescottella agglutinans]
MNTHSSPALTRIPDFSWQASARCRATATNMFFPRQTRSWGERIRLERAAKNVCAGCAVLLECRSYALEFEERFGVWGGLTEAERRSRLSTGRPSVTTRAHREPTSDP